MTTTVAAETARRSALSARRTEVRIARVSLAALALHFVDANFLQPRPGTAAGDHLTSGLLPSRCSSRRVSSIRGSVPALVQPSR